ncbi:hypothetical protein KIN20_021350 [Parelaphostrongylus tenuis]|uniref:Uncharacterized protein n=1 Tax=Parelaphostrongylus tenuis TaxID=148309 RepID=A0AAD5N552_PARTN|nr:hypothetical protein KIN20_021350 [Parelaphostrongylus tenuis]
MKEGTCYNCPSTIPEGTVKRHAQGKVVCKQVLNVGLVVHSNTGVVDETFACSIIGMKRQSGALTTD